MRVKYKITILSVFIILTLGVFGQKNQPKFKGIIGVEGRYTFEPFGNNLFPSFSGNLGLEINEQIRLTLGYKYSLALSYTGFYTRDNPKYQSIYFKTSYMFNKRNKRLSPILSLDFGTEVFSNYKYGFLDVDGFNPFDPLVGTDNHPGTFVNESNFYYSTPFFGSFNGGITIRVFSEFYLNILAGFSFRMIEYKYSNGLELDNYLNKAISAPTLTHYFHWFNTQFGLIYTFPLNTLKE